MTERIGVLGAGTWGTALACLFARKGYDVALWSSDPQKAAQLAATHVHPKLPGAHIPENVAIVSDIADACTDRALVVIAVSSNYVAPVASQAAPYLARNQVVAIAAKGIQAGTLLGMAEVAQAAIEEAQPGTGARLVAISGPTHAEEVSRNLPSLIVAASTDEQAALDVQRLMSCDSMRVYTNPDLVGVELCGALKNIIALAAGISTGLGFGDNARAAIITRGMEEIKRLGLACGCAERTFDGLAGIGDLVVTATSMHSRNNRAGILMGQGLPADQAIAEIGQVVEGVNALPAALQLAAAYGVEMPITTAVDAIVNGGADPSIIAGELMARDYKAE